MYTIDIAQQLLLYSHILVFALAMAEVLQEDWQMLRANRLDFHRLQGAAQRIKWLLLLLWASGIPLVGVSIGWDLSILMERPKLMAKIIVASTLTVNGILLHYVAFPLLKGPTHYPRLSAAVVSVLGSISTVSWLYAAFVGAARLINDHGPVSWALRSDACRWAYCWPAVHAPTGRAPDQGRRKWGANGFGHRHSGEQ